MKRRFMSVPVFHVREKFLEENDVKKKVKALPLI